MTSSSQNPQDQLRIAVAQFDAVMGDIAGNADRIRAARDAAALQGADLVVFPELFLTGYPPADLLLRPAFRDACRRAMEELAAESIDGPGLLIGAPWQQDDRLHNAVLLLEEGRIAAIRAKVELPDYGVFDERQVFAPGPMPGPIPFRGTRLGVPVGEDIWGPDVVECLAETGAEILIVPAASPYRRGVLDARTNVVVARVVESDLPLLYVNLVGGQDEMVFDGASLTLNADRFMAMQFPNFQERLRMTHWQRFENGWRCMEAPLADRLEGLQADYAALLLGVRDHVEKNRHGGVLVVLDGTPQSMLAIVLAIDALGAARVHAVQLANDGDEGDAGHARTADWARGLGVTPQTLELGPLVAAADAALAPLLTTSPAAAPARGLAGALLARLARDKGLLILAPALRSAFMLGTDAAPNPSAPAFNPLRDVFRQDLADLAGLRAGWKPVDAKGPVPITLPDLLDAAPHGVDAIVARLEDEGARVADLIAEGFDAQEVRDVEHRIAVAEHARRGAPLGIALSTRALGRARRYPVTQRFQDRG